MPDMTVEFEVECAVCGAGLCGQTTTTTTRRGIMVIVGVCEKCIGSAHDEGYRAGYDAAKEEE